jgi:hypothetical protein
VISSVVSGAAGQFVFGDTTDTAVGVAMPDTAPLAPLAALELLDPPPPPQADRTLSTAMQSTAR